MSEEAFRLDVKSTLNQYKHERNYLRKGGQLGSIGHRESSEIMKVIIEGLVYNSSFIFFLFLLDYFSIYLINWGYEIWGPLSLGWVIFLLGFSSFIFYLMKKFTAELKAETANLYFQEGVSAAFRQCYLASENMTEEKFKGTIDYMLTQNKHGP